MKLKIYEMNDVTEWWADYSLKAAKKNYYNWCLNDCQMDASEIELKDAREITSNELDRLKYIDEASQEKLSFRTQLSKLDKPQLFASTEY